ncbi:MAG: hypothetical protein PHG34_00525 [Candidatus Cloacimonetes bacterium]|jgi:hypothetical protein|nr:hypothetical protein [Candidatus Cloacimonadota bacterium]MDD2422680.1 hypothetical protein [Candidatus Cloacimonadota bacterium]
MEFETPSAQNIQSAQISPDLQIHAESEAFLKASPIPDRKAIDNIMFKSLGLNVQEAKGLYAGLLELTASKPRKARIFTPCLSN